MFFVLMLGRNGGFEMNFDGGEWRPLLPVDKNVRLLLLDGDGGAEMKICKIKILAPTQPRKK